MKFQKLGKNRWRVEGPRGMAWLEKTPEGATLEHPLGRFTTFSDWASARKAAERSVLAAVYTTSLDETVRDRHIVWRARPAPDSAYIAATGCRLDAWTQVDLFVVGKGGRVLTTIELAVPAIGWTDEELEVNVKTARERVLAALLGLEDVEVIALVQTAPLDLAEGGSGS